MEQNTESRPDALSEGRRIYIGTGIEIDLRLDF